MLIYIIPSFLLGLILGTCFRSIVVKKRGKRNKRIAENNSIQPILLDAKTNREISDIVQSIVQSSEDSNAQRILDELTDQVNKAAQDGRTILYVDNNLNKNIRKYLTRTIISNYFKPNGYTVDFTFSALDYADITSIKWGD